MIKNNRLILCCLLIISFLSQIFSQSNDALLKDISLCMKNNNTKNCTNVRLTSGVYQCCNVNVYSSVVFQSICSVQITPISEFIKFMETGSIKALYKEIFGYIIYHNSLNSTIIDYIKFKADYVCKDGNTTIKFGYDTYSDSEINVLQSENHCLSYIYYDNFFTSKQNCFNSVLTQNAKDAGLSCGYFEFHLKYSDGLTDTIQICNIFNSELINYGQLDDKTKESFETIISTYKDGTKVVISYNVEFSDKKGNTLFYDSTTQKVTGNSEIYSISKYLILFIVLLF
jgi:hypothetical protein